MMRDFDFLEQQFKIPGPIQNISSLGSGHIHDTYLVNCKDPQHSNFVLQKFNHKVFKNPVEVMLNISRVLDHINNSEQSHNLQPLRIIPTKDNALIHHDPDGNYWRLFNHIAESDSLDQVIHPEQAMGGAKAFAEFFRLLKDLDPSLLFTTIPDFHHLGVRFKQLQKAVVIDKVGRVADHQQEVTFALDRAGKVATYTGQIFKQEIPTRVTHNDTKINNVLFRKGTTQGICVLDLDTIMPGMLLYDFGDMARTFCNSVLEEGDAGKASFRLDIFESLCKGFFSSIRTRLSSEEVDSLRIGPWWMTFIMAIRFLTDFVSGDVYYKIAYDHQNLQRARNQLNLAADIEKKQAEINGIIDNSLLNYDH